MDLKMQDERIPFSGSTELVVVSLQKHQLDIEVRIDEPF